MGENNKCDLVRSAISSSLVHVAYIQESKLDRLDTNKARAFLHATLSCFADLPVDDSRGGIVTAWNPATLTASTPTRGLYTLTIPFTSTTSNYRFTVTNVYAPADHRDTDAFVTELSSIELDENTPCLLMGDYNLMRDTCDKNTSALTVGSLTVLTPPSTLSLSPSCLSWTGFTLV